MTAPTRSGGLMLVTAATLLWSTSGFFAKAPLLEYWPVADRGVQLAFWRVVFASCLLVPLVRRPTWEWRLIPAAVFFSLMNYCYLKAMTTTTAANAIWLQYTAPAWVLIVGVWLLKESYTGVDILTVVFTLIGVGIIVGCEMHFGAGEKAGIVGVGWGLAAGVMFAGTILSIRALRDLDSAWVVAVCHLSAAAFLLPWILWQSQWAPLNVMSWLAGFGVLQLGLPYWLFARGTRSVSGHEAAFIGLLEPMLVPLWTYACWRNAPGYQPPASWTLVGGGCILLALLMRFTMRK